MRGLGKEIVWELIVVWRYVESVVGLGRHRFPERTQLSLHFLIHKRNSIFLFVVFWMKSLLVHVAT